MNLFICIIIILGISLDVFATMEVEGAMVPEIKKGPLAIACAITTGISLGFFFGGYILCYEINEHKVFSYEKLTASIIAAVVFALLGVRLIVKAIRKEFVHESRREFGIKNYIKLIIVTSFYILAAGCACGFIEANPYVLLVTMIVCFILVVVGGILTGYHYGFEKKTFAYAFGATLLWIVGIYVILTGILPLV
ncbi:MAG: manganese efflux pump MntP family protein [Lachnospiraceae bacterium]|nr:manganese efflux pump MntP family protein [Lachnospiraceae bacterium]